NESTGTKAVFDLFSFFESNQFHELIELLMNNLTILFVPILNPDGALVYTRENAHGIDLNRDAVDLSAKESQLLNAVLNDFKPDFCFNLHDQRTIFNVEGTSNPATISFLAPSVDEERTLTTSRKKTMSVIVAMNQLLQEIIPNQVGRYTDEFYPTATGDNFQKAGYHTILVEAGHFKDDYDREEVRKFNFLAILQALDFISTTQHFDHYLPYFEIPNNEKRFFDVIYRNTLYENKIQDVAFQYHFKRIHHKLEKSLTLEKVGDLSNYLGHFEMNFDGNSFYLI
ncbi:MAG: M14 family zinc carboxypeptidase, partial [Flavobacteriaceae bacterium]|nr:M14 family zinc carboxypeptidase [Flavobacteriaceae bacterium]